MQQRSFVLFWLARLASTMGYQMLALTIGWQDRPKKSQRDAPTGAALQASRAPRRL